MHLGTPLPPVVADRLMRLDGLPAPDGPGCALGIYLDGQLVHASCHGLASVEQAVPLSPHSLFDVASVSKQFCAAAVLQLSLEGRIDLDADLRTSLFPELRLQVPVTARQCLHHTAGLRDYFSLLELAGRSAAELPDDDAVVALVARQRDTSFAPGSRHLYSNSGYVLLSALVKRATGQTLRDYTAAAIFGPLGMTATHFRDDVAEVVRGRATGHERGREGRWRLADAPFGVVGDGGLLTNLVDLGRWAAFLGTGEVLGVVLRDALLERIRLTDGTALDYARGLQHRRRRGVDLVEHGGSFVGFRAHLVQAPEQGCVVAVLGNRADLAPQRLALAALDIVLEHRGAELDDDEPVVPPHAADEPARLGLWRDPESGLYASTVERGGVLRIQALGLDLATQQIDGRLQLQDAPLPLEVNVSSTRLEFSLSGRTQGLPAYEPVQPTAETAGVAGGYRSDELEVEARVEQTPEGLLMTLGSAEPQQLHAAVDDELWCSSATVRVRRVHEQVVALELSNGRALRVRFDRVPAEAPS
ncbi:MAG: beta-lactamase family protein [Actinobacteria bacterium]|nr:beta-lactamase family protein [Actinomycetota bacterium]